MAPRLFGFGRKYGVLLKHTAREVETLGARAVEFNAVVGTYSEARASDLFVPSEELNKLARKKREGLGPGRKLGGVRLHLLPREKKIVFFDFRPLGAHTPLFERELLEERIHHAVAQRIVDSPSYSGYAVVHPRALTSEDFASFLSRAGIEVGKDYSPAEYLERVKSTLLSK